MTVDTLLSSIADAQAHETARDGRIRAEFERRTGHPRGVAVVGRDAAVWADLQAIDPPAHEEADGLVEDVARAYVAASPEEQRQLAAAVDGAPYVRWRLGFPCGRAIRRLEEASRSPEDRRDDLSFAVACIALAAGRDDYRDTIVTLDRLHLAAFRAGIDPLPAIAAAVERTRDERGGATDASKLLAYYLDDERRAALRDAANRPPRGPDPDRVER